MTVDCRERPPLRCRLGWHKKRPRLAYWSERTFLLLAVNLYECEHCDWRMRGIGEPVEHQP
jgi:hypothetical protein